MSEIKLYIIMFTLPLVLIVVITSFRWPRFPFPSGDRIRGVHCILEHRAVAFLFGV